MADFVCGMLDAADRRRLVRDRKARMEARGLHSFQFSESDAPITGTGVKGKPRAPDFKALPKKRGAPKIGGSV